MNSKDPVDILQEIFGPAQVVILDGSDDGWHHLEQALQKTDPEFSSDILAFIEIIEAAQEFVHRCELGHVKSVHSYGRFKAALERLGAWPLPAAPTAPTAGEEPQA